MNKINIVNPLNPNEIIKTVELIDKEEIKEEVKEEVKKVKKKPKLLLPIIILVIALIGFLIFFLTRNKDNDTEINEPVINPELSTVLSKLEDDKEFKKYTSFNKVENNKLLITTTLEDAVYSYEYVLEDNKLTTKVHNDDELNMLFLVIDAIAQKNNIIEGKTYEYLKNINFKTENIDGIEIKDNVYTIDINKTFDTISSYNYFSKDELTVYKDFIINTGNVHLEKNNLVLYKLDNNEYINIIIGQKNELDELTYNTILSIVEVTFENELNNFKTNYTTLETKSYERYTITINPSFDNNVNNLISNYKNSYKFVQLNIKKS